MKSQIVTAEARILSFGRLRGTLEVRVAQEYVILLYQSPAPECAIGLTSQHGITARQVGLHPIPETYLVSRYWSVGAPSASQCLIY
jgi:hypothetical protein